MVSAQPLGFNQRTQKYEAVVKATNYEKTGKAVIRQFDDVHEARKFIYNVNHHRIPNENGTYDYYA